MVGSAAAVAAVAAVGNLVVLRLLKSLLT